jgi:nucleoside-diphosphate-sugar epimerase
MSTSFDRLPKNALVLVTGATGYIGSYVLPQTFIKADLARAVVDVLLQRGYRVRATTRSEAKATKWAQHFTKKFPSANVEFVAFADYTNSAEYSKVLKGRPHLYPLVFRSEFGCAVPRAMLITDVDGVVHLATDTTFGSSYDQVVAGSAAASLALLRAAANFPQIKSVVLTSSVVAALNLDSGKDVVVDQDSYNSIAEAARSVDPSDPKAGHVMCKQAHEHSAVRA